MPAPIDGMPGPVSFTAPAEADNIPQAMEKIEGLLERLGCPAAKVAHVCTAADEILSNIVFYAYTGGAKGSFTVEAEPVPGGVRIVFSDSGVPFDPLKREDPDVTLPADERPVGGLGIMMVKNLMDSVGYERKDGRNVLTVLKNF